MAERGRISQEMESVRSGGNVGVTERQSTGDLSGNDQHPAEEATETFDRERDMAILDSLQNEFDEVEAALERLENGGYGKCEVCGKPIGNERLQALPSTRFCIEHERAREEASLRPSPNTPDFGGS